MIEKVKGHLKAEVEEEVHTVEVVKKIIKNNMKGNNLHLEEDKVDEEEVIKVVEEEII
jgi:hypothetical protein